MAQQQDTPATPAATTTQTEAPADGNAALIAELSALDTEGEAAATEDAATETEEATETAAEGEESEAGEESDEDESADEDKDEGETDAAAKTDDDPDLAKRLETIQKAQKRSADATAREREQLAAERQKIEADLAPKLESAQRFEEAQKRAAYDPAGVLAALGVPEDSYEAAARQLYAMSKAGAADPKLRDSATRSLREREMADQLQQTQTQLQELTQRMEQERAQQAQAQQVESYLDTVTKAVTDEAPLVRTMLEKTPAKTRKQFATTAERLLAETGEVPEAADVVAALEQTRRAELDELGIDVKTIIKTKTKPPDADESKRGKTLTAQMGTPKKPRTEPLSEEELRAEMLRDLQAGNLE